MKIPPCLFWMGCPTIPSWVNRPCRQPGKSAAPLASPAIWRPCCPGGGEGNPKRISQWGKWHIKGAYYEMCKVIYRYSTTPTSSISCCQVVAPPVPSAFSTVSSTPTDSWPSNGTFVFTPKKSHCTPRWKLLPNNHYTVWCKLIYTNIKLLLWAQSFLGSYSLVITTFSNCVSQLLKMRFPLLFINVFHCVLDLSFRPRFWSISAECVHVASGTKL